MMSHLFSLYRNKILISLLFSHVGLLCLLLILDVSLVDWYRKLYNSVVSRNDDAFFRAIAEFLVIATAQAVINAATAYLSDMHEACLKKHFSLLWRDHGDGTDLHHVRRRNIDQKIIDDAVLASERISHIAPEMVYNFFKALTFLALLQSFKIGAVFGVSWSFFLSPLIVFGFSYIVLQFFVLRKARSWIGRSENLKRQLEARLRYSLLEQNVTSALIAKSTNAYIKYIYRIRHFVARAHSYNLFTIHLFSLSSIVVPMILSYEALSRGSIDFGDFMKIGATYAGFQSAFTYILTFYRSIYQGLSALDRLMRSDGLLKIPRDELCI